MSEQEIFRSASGRLVIEDWESALLIRTMEANALARTATLTRSEVIVLRDALNAWIGEKS